MHRRTFLKKSGKAGLVTFISPRGIFQVFGRLPDGDLDKRFHEPLTTDYPQTFWFWMNGHISKEGITLDLEAMKRAGIGGVFNFDAGISIPKGPVEYLSPEWQDLKQHAIKEADRLGLQFTLHNCPGWSSSGGPWITPELAMQQLTWSEVYVEGGHTIEMQLPVPFHKLNFYRDVAVLAYPSLQGEIHLQAYSTHSSSGPVSKKAVTGEDPDGVTVRPTKENEFAWLQFEFSKPSEVRFITFLISAARDSKNNDPGGRTSVLLESSDNGINFSTIATIGTGLEAELIAGDKFITYDIPPTKAKYFRLRSSQPRRYSQIRFSGITRLKNFMEKTGNRFMFSGEETSPLYNSEAEQVPADSAIHINSIVDISKQVDQNGFLQWNAPDGLWTILRFGHTATGAVNKAAPDNGTGLECDKFSREAIDFHFSKMMNHLQPALRAMSVKGKIGFEIDSYEAGPQTWTQKFPEEFHKRCGYSLIQYLPAITGRIINDADYTERFLWNYRRTQADLIADHYYGRFTELCHQQDITSYVQPYDKGPFEEMQIGSRADVNLGEFWYGLNAILQGNLAVRRTSKLAASIMNTNGRKIVGAESFTSEPESSRWQEYPFSLKALGDRMFCHGINQMIIHRFVHQPHPFARPGMTMGPWGIHFDRTNTWFEKAKDWLMYNARCQAMLRQGLPVIDLVYFTGEEANVYTRATQSELHPSPPQGYHFDLINAETILHKVQIKNGHIVLPHGMRYRVLVLQGYKGVTMKLLRKLRSLVAEGMILVGKKPERSLGLNQHPNDTEFQKTADELWGTFLEKETVQNSFGKGQVIWGPPLSAILQNLRIAPDLETSSRSGDAPLLFIHRSTGETEIYFICNQKRSFEEVVCSFRVKNKQPEIWDPTTGKMVPAPMYELHQDRVRMPLQLEPYGSLFIIFRSPASGQRLLSIKKGGREILSTNPYPVRSRKLYRDISNNFSISLWAKPEMNIMTRASIHMGNLNHPYTDYYAIYPSVGRDLYGAGHATCGLAIGRNGVAVWESEAHPVLVLVAEAPLAGWSQVTLVYKDGIPFVYINGQMIGKGEKSTFIIHPGTGDAFIYEGASYYNGDMTDPQLSNGVLNSDRIRQQADKKPPAPPLPSLIQTISHQQTPALLVWENGSYSMQKSSGQTTSFSVKNIPKPLEVKGTWEVEFPPHTGAPSRIHLPDLTSLHRIKEEGVRYFSGTAIYKHQFTIDQSLVTDKKRLFLDLGRVEVIAEVWINGKDLGILWKRPYRVDITDAVKTGMNHLMIKVTNLWPNRLIGDEQLPDPDPYSLAGANGFEHLMGAGFEQLIGSPIQELPDWYLKGEPQPKNGRISFTTWKHYKKDDPLLESGLLGPVMLIPAVIKFI